FRAFPNLTESRKRSKSLFGRIFLTRTGVHFARKCSRAFPGKVDPVFRPETRPNWESRAFS
ncbi:MAG: hypothetical protein E2O89_06100, partial [Alphaproteobacteria bacterium]